MLLIISVTPGNGPLRALTNHITSLLILITSLGLLKVMIEVEIIFDSMSILWWMLIIIAIQPNMIYSMIVVEVLIEIH